MFAKKYIRFFSSLIILLTLCFNGMGQERSTGQQLKNEELIRYLGYEEVPTRYLSLPYDVTMGHNVEGHFMDMGYLLLLWIPILLLFYLKKNVYRFIIIGLMLFTTILSIGSGYVLDNRAYKVINDGSSIDQLLDQNKDVGFLTNLTANVYKTIEPIYRPIGNMLESLTKNGDGITYPLLTILLFLFVFLVAKSKSNLVDNRSKIMLFSTIYFFFMWILSAGVVWYGFLVMPFLYILIIEYGMKNKILKNALLLTSGLFLMMAYFLKLSNKQVFNDTSRQMLAGPVVEYQFGVRTESELFDAYYNNLSKALTKINADKSGKVYKIGTQLAFMIDNNNERVYKDDLLGLMNNMILEYKSKNKVNQALRKTGYKYIMFSPNILQIDRTPDRTLAKKYGLFKNYITNNVGLELLSTDRYIKNAEENSTELGVYSMNEGEELKPGKYAIFEIK